MPDYLTVPSAIGCLVLCAGLVASILGLATDDWLEIEQRAKDTTTNLTTTTAIRYGIWRKCLIELSSVDQDFDGKNCVELVDDGTTAWVMASAVMMIYATVASAVALVLWMIWTFFSTKRSQSCIKIFTAILVISAIFFYFVIFVGWISEREDTRDDAFDEVAGRSYSYSCSFDWSWGMVILAFIIQIFALVLMLISGARD